MNWASGRLNVIRSRVRLEVDSEDLPAATARIRQILDVTIIVLMVAILLSVSLPVCISIVESRANQQAATARY
jgi:hypothetical protein